MLKKYLAILAMMLGVFMIFGCSITQPENTLLGRNWGRSLETAKFNQRLNPNAGNNPRPVVGLDGVAADLNIKKYQNSFKEESSESVYNISLTGIGTK